MEGTKLQLFVALPTPVVAHQSTARELRPRPSVAFTCATTVLLPGWRRSASYPTFPAHPQPRSAIVLDSALSTRRSVLSFIPHPLPIIGVYKCTLTSEEPAL